MLGRAASLQAGRKENRWPTGGRGSRVGPPLGWIQNLLQDWALDFCDHQSTEGILGAGGGGEVRWEKLQSSF